MPIEVKCPACKTKMDAEYDQKLTCPECGESFTAPPPPAPKPLAPAPVVVAPPPAPPPAPNPFDFEAKPESDEDDEKPRASKFKKRAPKPGQREMDRAAARWWLKWLGILGSIFVLTVLGCCGYGGYLYYAEQRLPLVPPFEEPRNPYKPGTQTNLREIRTIPLPANRGFVQLVHAPNHNLLFVRGAKDIWVYDLSDNTTSVGQQTTDAFTDMSLSPDRSVLFVAELGASGTPPRQVAKTKIHRFDIVARSWDAGTMPAAGYRIEAVDANRFLLLTPSTPGGSFVDLTLNKWESKKSARELARTGCGHAGDIEYDPRTGRAYHGDRGLTSLGVLVRTVERNKLTPAALTGSSGAVNKDIKGFDPSFALSQDGSRLYFGPLQINAAALEQNLVTFPENILAASRDVAFSSTAYYRADDGTKLGQFDFKLGLEPKNDPMNKLPQPAAIHVSPDGVSVWVIDRDKNVARQFALEGEE